MSLAMSSEKSESTKIEQKATNAYLARLFFKKAFIFCFNPMVLELTNPCLKNKGLLYDYAHKNYLYLKLTRLPVGAETLFASSTV